MNGRYSNDYGAGIFDRLPLAVCPELASGEVVSLHGGSSLPSMDPWAIYPSGRLTSTMARVSIMLFGIIIK